MGVKTRRRMLGGLITLYLLFPFSAFPDDWIWQYPLAGGRVPHGISFADENNGWIAGSSGSVMRTTNGGDQWVDLGTGLAEDILSIHFNNSMLGWGAGKAGFIARTTNAGETWIVQQSGTTADLHSIYFVGVDTGWAVGAGGVILKSSNGGIDWNVQPSGTTLSLFCVRFIDAVTGWSCGALGIVLQTVDGGNQWTIQPTGTSLTFYSLDAPEPLSLWAAGWAGAVFHTSDGGNSWMLQETGTVAPLTSIEFVDTNNGWAVSNGSSEILETTDGGETWTSRLLGGANTRHTAVHFAGAERGWITGFRTEMGDTITTVFQTLNGGIDWEPYPSPEIPRLSDVQFITDQIGWAVGWSQDHWVARTTNGGSSWTSHPYSWSHMYNLSFVDSLYGWGFGAQGSVYQTTDGGVSWLQHFTGFSGVGVNNGMFVDRTNGWVVMTNGLVLHTTQGGDMWEIQLMGSVSLESIWMVNQHYGWACGMGGVMYQTTNGGMVWNSQQTGTSLELRSIFFSDTSNGWVVGENGLILYTSNGGIDWEQQESGTTAFLTSVHFVDPLNGSASTAIGSDLLKTSNGGLEWTVQATVPRPFLGHVYFHDANLGWAVGSLGFPGVILHTATGGTGVEPLPPPLPSFPPDGDSTSTNPILEWSPSVGAFSYTLQVSTSQFFITKEVNLANLKETSYQLTGALPDTTYYWRVSGTDSTGTSSWSHTWSFTIAGVVSGVVLTSPAPTAFSLSLNYPNPFNASTTFQVDLPIPGLVKLRLFDILGRELPLGISRQFSEGSHRIEIDMSSVGSGTYLYSIESLSRRFSGKLILLK